ncbi:DNA polymerase Y family protein [Actinosynnema sp. NPDC020468]|uniref:Y-family DNA polymerase n=1 Tax=Actinosynnema sp. NPDC020468 TaxID=3154488 RepID=UPI0033C7D56B
MISVHTLVLWCPDWPVVAACAEAALPAHVPAAVVRAGAVVACSAIARAEGVRRGERKRSAQGRCPELVLFEHDDARDARVFEPVAAAVEAVAPGIEVVRPGLVALDARGPVGYYGSPERVAELLLDHVAGAGVEAQVGFADGLFAATRAAQRGLIVPPGRSAEFLAELGIHELDQPAEHRQGRAELVDLLRRLGLRTLGAFAAVPERDVATRFGSAAVLAHRLASGLDERPRDRRRPPADLTVRDVFDPPVDRVDAAAFAAKALAEQLHAVLADRGLACTRLAVEAVTDGGEELRRVWRAAEPLTPQGIADRVRWQLDGWLTRARPTGPLVALRLDPEEVVDATLLQGSLWGEDQDAAAGRAARAMVHVQGLLGPEAVLTPVLGGGKGPAERVTLVPWGDERTPGLDPDRPWPGRLPAPSPATVFARPEPAVLVDDRGADVVVTGAAELVVRPHRIVHAGRTRRVLAWSGPWPVDERWWDEPNSVRAARLQVLGADAHGRELAFLLIRARGKWAVEGVYD